MFSHEDGIARLWVKQDISLYAPMNGVPNIATKRNSNARNVLIVRESVPNHFDKFEDSCRCHLRIT